MASRKKPRPKKSPPSATGKPQPAPVKAIAISMALVAAGVYFYKNVIQRPSVYSPLAVKASVDELKNGNCKEINELHPGEQIELPPHMVYGRFTLFDFFSEYCGPCMELSERLVDLTKQRPDIAVRSINVNRNSTQGIDWDSPVCKQYNIHSLPYLMLYGPDGKLIAQGSAAKAQVIEMLNKEVYN